MMLDFCLTNSCPSPIKSPSTRIEKSTRSIFASEFIQMFDSGKLPLRAEPYGTGLKLVWLSENVEDLDYLDLIPLFLKGTVFNYI